MNESILPALLITGVSLSGCVTAQKISVSNVKDMKGTYDRSFIYTLPQTVFDVTVTAREITVIPGIYAEYASELLGIENAPLQEESIWSITGVTMGVHSEADPDFVYSVKATGNITGSPSVARLVSDSLILLDNNFAGARIFYNSAPVKIQDIYIADPTLGKDFVFDDTEMPEDLPPVEAIAGMTPEEKAREAANLIQRIKRRKAGLATATYEYIPDGFDLEAAIKELDRMEKEYMSYFTGREIINNHVRNFHFVPGSVSGNERHVLVTFSEQDGFVAEQVAGKPLILQLESRNKTAGLEASAPFSGQDRDVLAYRIPDLAAVKVSIGEEPLADAFFPVFQYGKIVTMKPW
jgi:hypothetical protein